MKIAAITITYNDDYKFKEWYNHYKKYKEEIYLHIIIDNNSTYEYLKKVKSYFKESVIIEMGFNGGCTASYNAGIKYALDNQDIDSIALIGNDIMIDTGGITKLYNFLMSNYKLGMVEPVILENNGLINEYGCEINTFLSMKPYMSGMQLSDISKPFQICTTVTGGMNLAKREFYEEIGFQDENLFMYSDEVDMGIRAKKKGVLMAATKDAIAWHMHINDSNRTRRHPFSRYLIARNKVYIGKKHFGTRKAFLVFLFFFYKSMSGLVKNIFKFKSFLLQEHLWQIYGAFSGLFNNMHNNKFSQL